MATRYHQGPLGPVYTVDGVAVHYEVHLAPRGTTGTAAVPTARVRCDEHGATPCAHQAAAAQFRRAEARDGLRCLGLLS